jgi:hypothetical protein
MTHCWGLSLRIIQYYLNREGAACGRMSLAPLLVSAFWPAGSFASILESVWFVVPLPTLSLLSLESSTRALERGGETRFV